MTQFVLRTLPRVSQRISCVYRYTDDIPEEDPLPNDLVWNQATQGLLDRLFKDDEPRSKALSMLLRKGALGVLIHNSASWAGHCFVAPPGISLPSHLPKSLTKDFWWMFYMHTKDDFRGQGLQKAYIRLCLILVRNLNGSLESVFSDTSVDNTASRKGHLSAGFEPYGIIRQLELKIPKIGPLILHHEWTSDSHPEMQEIQ